MIDLITILENIRDFLKGNFFILFKEETVPVALAVVLLALGSLCVAYLVVLKWIPIRLRLSRVEAIVRKTGSEIGFAQNYDSVDSAFSQVRFLRHGWTEFEKSHVELESTEDQSIRYNTERPSSYINLASAETAGVRIRFMQAVPNYFVGFGLLFTFLGLVAAIFFASEGIATAASSGDVRATQESLQNLLNAATFKFLTSVAGITSSLVVAITYRLVSSSLHNGFDRLCAAVEERMRFVTPEFIAAQQYRELQRQTTQLERFNTDLAVQIADSLDTRISASFERAVQPLLATMGGMVERLGNMNQDALGTMLESFVTRLQAGAGTELEQLARNIGESGEALTQLGESISRSGDTLSNAVASLEERFTNIGTSLNDSISESMNSALERLQSQIEEAGRHVNESFSESSGEIRSAFDEISEQARDFLEPLREHLDDFQERMSQLSDRLANQIEAIDGVNSGLREVATSTESAASGLRTAVNPFTSAASAMDTAAHSIGATSETMGEVLNNLKQLADTMSRAAKTTTASWENYETRFASVDQDLGRAVERFQQSILEQQNSIARFISELDAQINQALQHLGSGISGLEDAIEDLNENLSRLETNRAI